MEGGLERNNSMLGKDSIISKRKRIAVITAVLIVVLVVVIGLAVGVSQKRNHSATKEAPPAPPTEKPITTKPPGLVPVPSKSLSVQRQTVLAQSNKTLDAITLDKFLSKLQDIADSNPLAKVNLTAHHISSNSLLMYLRDMRVEPVLDALMDFADTGALPSLSDLQSMLPDIQKMLTPAAIRDWGKLLAEAHRDTHGVPESAAAMVEAAAAKGIPLPNSTITDKAIAKAQARAASVSIPFNNTIAHIGRRLVQEDRIARLGRKLAQAVDFSNLCIPIVFNVLQFDYVNSDYETAVFPGTGYAPYAQHLVDRLNMAFSNEEWNVTFGNDAADTLIRFQVGAVLEDPTVTPYLGVTQDEWASCADNDALMQVKATAASADFPTTQYINVIVCGDYPEDGTGVLGYAFVPDTDFVERVDNAEYIYLRFDEFYLNNNAEHWDRGGWTLTHEVGHHFGLYHPHAKKDDTCGDGDDLADTSDTKVVQLQPYYNDLQELCDGWRLDGVWYGTGSEGYSMETMSSCPPRTSPDPVFNIMEYTASSCYSYFTPQQVAYLQLAVPYYRPQMYQNAAGACASRK